MVFKTVSTVKILTLTAKYFRRVKSSNKFGSHINQIYIDMFSIVLPKLLK